MCVCAGTFFKQTLHVKWHYCVSKAEYNFSLKTTSFLKASHHISSHEMIFSVMLSCSKKSNSIRLTRALKKQVNRWQPLKDSCIKGAWFISRLWFCFVLQNCKVGVYIYIYAVLLSKRISTYSGQKAHHLWKEAKYHISL